MEVILSGCSLGGRANYIPAVFDTCENNAVLGNYSNVKWSKIVYDVNNFWI